MSINFLDDKILENLKDTIQDSNINFLIGSGLSKPYLSTLGNIEKVLTEIDQRDDIDKPKKEIVRSMLYKQYCEQVIFKNIPILENDSLTIDVFNNYKQLLVLVNSILLNRKNPILSKQVNIFTTNIDIYLEKALDALKLEYSDGFSGRFSPSFDLSNFRKTVSKRSLQFDNVSEIPSFNLLKLHGSLTWEIDSESENRKGIKFCSDLKLTRDLKKLDLTSITEATNDQTIEDLIAQVGTKRLSQTVVDFLKQYQELPIINPTKDKFKQTLLNQIHYELLRMYANELEKDNSVLFVMGFSFEDEHIREITLRVANSNPTLMIYIVAHSGDSASDFDTKLGVKNAKNKNIKIITPDKKDESEEDSFKYDLSTINLKIFEPLMKKTEPGKSKQSTYNA